MAGLIKALFGGRSRPPDPDPLPGVGGYRLPTGRTGEGGYPGTTSPTRHFKGSNPRGAKVRADSNTGWEGELSGTKKAHQAAYRADQAPTTGRQGATGASSNPRLTSRVVTPRTRIQATMQDNSPAEFYGGPMLKTGPGNDTAGANPGRRAAAAGGHAQRDTETPPTQRQSQISLNTPGANNVRNETAQRYKAVPGEVHVYKSAPRGDLPQPLRKGQNADGNVHPEMAVTEVAVPSRFVFAGGGVQTWSVERQMPYTGRGDGARGADLNGSRYYATFQGQQFMNAGMGNYGIARHQGGDHKRPVSFSEPAPWTANYYDTTEDVGTTTDPGVPSQAPSNVYISPSTGRASNGTGRTG